MNFKLPKNAINAIMRSKTCSKQFQILQDDEIQLTEETLDWFKKNIGIKDQNSSFIPFYAVVGFPPENDNSPELSTLDRVIADSLPDGFYADYFVNYPEIAGVLGKRFFVLTGGEEEGFFFYDSEADAVYDTDDFSLMKHNTWPDPKWKSFFDFLDNYYGDGIYP